MVSKEPTYIVPAANQPPPTYLYTSVAANQADPLANYAGEVSEDDFFHGVDVKSSHVNVRMDFVRKVYSILLTQLLATSVVGAILLKNESAKFWVHENSWAFITSTIMTFVFLGCTYWKRHSVPTNYAFLAGFTLFEAYTLGTTVAYFDVEVVLQAFIITTGVVLGLTLFTFQTKYDFDGLAPFLTGALWMLVLTSFVQIFLPFNKTFDLFMAVGSALVFIGFILFDTQQLFKLSPEEYIHASISLYLDILNLFLSILRILQDSRD